MLSEGITPPMSRQGEDATEGEEPNDWLCWVAWAVVVMVLVALGMPWWASALVAIVFSVIGQAALKRWPTS